MEIPAEELGGVHGYLAVRRPVEKRHADVANVAVVVQAAGLRQQIFDRLVVVSFLLEHLRHPFPALLAGHVRVFNPTRCEPITSRYGLKIGGIFLLASQEERDTVMGLRNDQPMLVRADSRHGIGAKSVAQQNRVEIIRDAASFASCADSVGMGIRARFHGVDFLLQRLAKLFGPFVQALPHPCHIDDILRESRHVRQLSVKRLACNQFQSHFQCLLRVKQFFDNNLLYTDIVFAPRERCFSSPFWTKHLSRLYYLLFTF